MTTLERRRPYAGPDPIYGPLSRYFHSNGWMIRKEVRDWDARPYRGSAGNPDRKVSWVIYPVFRPASKYVEVFDTLREARKWCDANPRHAR